MDVDKIAKRLSKPARHWLHAICGANGGGISVRCVINGLGEVVPMVGPIHTLYKKGLIQGKSRGIEQVVHTKLGLAVRKALMEMNDG